MWVTRSCARRSRRTPGSHRHTTPPGRTTRAISPTAATGDSIERWQSTVTHSTASNERVGEREAAGVAGHDVGGRVELAVERERQRLEVGRDERAVLGEPGAGRPGAGAEVEEAAARGQAVGEQLLQEGTRRAVPPVRVLDRRHAAVLVELHLGPS